MLCGRFLGPLRTKYFVSSDKKRLKTVINILGKHETNNLRGTWSSAAENSIESPANCWFQINYTEVEMSRFWELFVYLIAQFLRVELLEITVGFQWWNSGISKDNLFRMTGSFKLDQEKGLKVNSKKFQGFSEELKVIKICFRTFVSLTLLLI